MSKETQRRVERMLFVALYLLIVAGILTVFVIPAFLLEKQANAEKKADTAVVGVKSVEKKADDAVKKVGVALDKAAKNHDVIEKVKAVVKDTQKKTPTMTQLQRINELKAEGEGK